jgi:ABC-type branched-subunit amino acid transport system substrate-binding protein
MTAPVGGTPARQKFPPGASWLAVGAVLAALAVASFISILPTFKSQPIAGGPGVAGAAGGGSNAGSAGVANGNPAASGVPGATGGAVVAGGNSGAASSTGSATTGAATCAAGQNGGATDTGVTATSIALASTVAESGIAESFLGDVRNGMTAVVNQVNRTGGICGRQLALTLTDDGWSAPQGEQDIRNFIAQGTFALPVVPSSQGLDAASRAGVIDQAGIPVVGTDGMLNSQYSDPWIWPVSASTLSTAHIAAATAYKAGARTFGIVYDKDYKFGPEGETAFKGAISRLSGAKLLADVGISSGQTDYSGPGGTFNTQCRSGGANSCDMIFVLLEPDNAETWFGTSGMNSALKLTEGPQPLFVDTFGKNCGQPCNNMEVWTSYYPNQAPYVGNAAVSAYVNAVRSVSSSADLDNQFLEGGYDGMELFVQALKSVGPKLTRAALRDVLNSTTFDSGLSQPMHWSGTNHYANISMLGFSVQYSGGFNGFQYQQTGWVADPWPTLDH